MNDGVTTYRSGERDLRVLHSDVGERSQKTETHAYTQARIEVLASMRIAIEGRPGSGIGMTPYGALRYGRL